MLLIMAYAMRHRLTGQALTDLLSLIEIHCLVPNLCKKTTSVFKQYFQHISSPIEFHYYCSTCSTYIGQSKTDKCQVCQEDSSKTSYFIMIPLIYQLQSLFTDGSLLKKIQLYKEQWRKKVSSSITDVVDGQLYKEKFNEAGFFKDSNPGNHELHISFQLNTDGVSIFRSSTFSVWPLYLVINEIPPDIRFSRSNRIFAGLWFGKQKPNFRIFLQPFAKIMKNLFVKGFWTKDKINIKGILLSGVFDSPARCLVQNIVQFNGFYGCPYCLIPGETFKTSARGCTHIYPFNEDSISGCHAPRTHQQTVENARVADEKCKASPSGRMDPVLGVKGTTWSMFFPHFDIVRGVGLDYMHCVCLGVMKKLLHLWFDKSLKKESFNISAKIQAVNEQLMMIKPPNFSPRLPRPLTDLGHYKAAEYKSFLLYYGIPCLWGILPQECFQHFLLLVEAIYLLLGCNIQIRQLKKAKKMLIQFCYKMKVIYGVRQQTSNVHLLLHAVEKVRDLGPLWANSCFYFEDFNGQLRTLFHGTQKIEKQISLAVCISQSIPNMASNLVFGTAEHDFYYNLEGRSLASPAEKSCDGYGVLGSLSNSENIENNIFQKLQSLFGLDGFKFWKFQRAKVRELIIHSMSYTNVKRRNSYTIAVSNCHFLYGQIQYFLKISVTCPNVIICNNYCPCQVNRYMAVIQPCEILNINMSTATNVNVSHLVPVQLCATKFELVDLCNVCDLCYFIQTPQCAFVSRKPNPYEKE